MCLGLFCINSKSVLAQTDSTERLFNVYNRISGNADLSTGKVRGFVLGDSIAVVLRSERAILEAQGDDFLYYRVLCDSILSAEISYTFDENGLLISIGIVFFESNMCDPKKSLSNEFLMQINRYHGNCMEKKAGYFECTSITGIRVEFQKETNEMCLIHTQIEFY